MSLNLEVIILSPEYEALGPVNKMTALRWTERSHSFGDFELWCPLTAENAELLQKENLVWIGSDTVGVIEVIQKAKDSEGSLSLQVSGRFNECWLERRIVWDRYSGTNYVSNHMRNLVYANAVNPTLSVRRLPHIVLSDDQGVQGSSIALSVHRDNLWGSLDELGKTHGLSPRLANDVPSKTASFVVRKGVDRSINQSSVPAVVLSSELSDILSSDYSSDSTSFKNTALVAGAGEGDARKQTTVNPENSGLIRRELSVDARDISDMETWNSSISIEVTILDEELNGSGEPYRWRIRTVTTKTLTNPKTGETRVTTDTKKEWVAEEPTEGTTTETGTEEVEIEASIYAGMLSERGKAYLSENPKIEAFNSQVRMQGARAYTYGEDYFLGDRITVQDIDLKIEVSTEVTEVEQTWDEEGYSVTLTLGDSAPTIKELIQKRS